jgi:di/tricarboxylate transporter
MFEIAPVGLLLASLGILYMLTLGVRLLPSRRDQAAGSMSIREYLAEVVILPDSPLIGQESHRSDFSVLGFQVLKIFRHGQDVFAGPHERLEVNDTVLVAGKVEDLIKIKKIEGLDILEDATLRDSGLQADDMRIAEVILMPYSPLVGCSLRTSKFRQISGLSVLAIHRGDKSLNKATGDVILAAGDVLLMQGPYERLRSYEEQSHLVIVSQHEHLPSAQRKGLLVMAAFLLAILFSSLDLVSIEVAILAAAVFTVLIKAIKLETAYENIDWRLLILIGGMTAFGEAMSRSGAAEMLATSITGALGQWGPQAVLAGFCVLTALLTQPMSNAAAALVVLPVALQAASLMEVNERTFGIGVMLSASISMLTPFEPACILVYGPGQYRFRDFLTVGGGLTVLMLTIIILTVPMRWPL